MASIQRCTRFGDDPVVGTMSPKIAVGGKAGNCRSSAMMRPPLSDPIVGLQRDFVICFHYRSDALRVQHAFRLMLGRFGPYPEPTLQWQRDFSRGR
jgi:hypothetical protein